MLVMRAVSFTLFQTVSEFKLFSLFKKLFNKKKGPFQFSREGRCGSIKFNENGFKKELYWEMSGSKDYDILMSPINIKHWDEPQGKDLSEEERLNFLYRLRNYLDSIKFKTDIHFPDNLSISNRKCVWEGCDSLGFDKLSYCKDHYDQLMLSNDFQAK